MASQQGGLINDVRRLVKSYHENKEKGVNVEKEDVFVDRDAKVTENRKKGCDELFEHIKGLIPDKVKTYAGYGRNEARVFEFKFRDEIKFGNCYAKDLLTKGDVVQRLQEFLDSEHSDETGPAFFVYFTHIGRYQADHAENKFGVFVNWDKDSWGAIKERLTQKPVRGRPEDGAPRDGAPSQAPRGRGRGGFSSRGRGGGRGGFSSRGRGGGRGFGRAPASAPAEKDDLPETHDE
jgi:hypothetical protein